MSNATLHAFKIEVKEAVEILKLNKTKIHEVAGKTVATKWGIFFLLVPAVLNLFLMSFSFPSGLMVIFKAFVFWAVFIPVLSLVGMVFGMAFFAKEVFKVQLKPVELFRVLSYASIILWVTVVIFLFSMLGLFFGGNLLNLIYIVAMAWMLYISYFFLMEKVKLPQNKAFIVLAVGLVLYFILNSLLGNLLIGSYFNVF